MAKRKRKIKVAVAVEISQSGVLLIPSSQGHGFLFAEVGSERDAHLAILDKLQEQGVSADLIKILPSIKAELQDVRVEYFPVMVAYKGKPAEGARHYRSEREVKIDPRFAALSRFLFLYLPYLQGKKREVPLEVEDQERASWCLESLEYFKRRIPKGRRAMWVGLYESPSSPSRLFTAYDELMAEFGLNPGEYAEYQKYRFDLRNKLQ